MNQSKRHLNDSYYLTARQAAAALGVTRASLYAYASRGLVRSEPLAGKTRERRYHRDDVERLKDRKVARRDPANAARRGLHWGAPVLDSGITLIDNGRLYYRGRDVIGLSRTLTAEQVAALLWGDEALDIEAAGAVARISLRQIARLRACSTIPLVQLQTMLSIAGAADVPSHDLRPAAVRQTGLRIIRLMTAVAANSNAGDPLHLALQRAWAPRRPAVADIIRTILVLCADHELNVSAFTARCAASAGATPYDVVSAAMSTLKGFKHGGAAERVIAMAKEARTPSRARQVAAACLRGGEMIPGFGHPLYPSGDPRGLLLVRLASESDNDKAWRPFRNLLRAGSALLQDVPNLDFGLAAVSRAHRLPDHAPLLLFALSRTIGWIAHAIEEYASGQLIRPRARYTGPQPIVE